jgi:hypothetical protein
MTKVGTVALLAAFLLAGGRAGAADPVVERAAHLLQAPGK